MGGQGSGKQRRRCGQFPNYLVMECPESNWVNVSLSAASHLDSNIVCLQTLWIRLKNICEGEHWTKWTCFSVVMTLRLMPNSVLGWFHWKLGLICKGYTFRTQVMFLLCKICIRSSITTELFCKSHSFLHIRVRSKQDFFFENVTMPRFRELLYHTTLHKGSVRGRHPSPPAVAHRPAFPPI